MSDEIIIEDRTRVKFIFGPRKFEVYVSIREIAGSDGLRIEAEGQISIEPNAANNVVIREWRPWYERKE